MDDDGNNLPGAEAPDDAMAWLEQNADEYAAAGDSPEAHMGEALALEDMVEGAEPAAETSESSGKEDGGEESSSTDDDDSPTYKRALDALKRGLPEGMQDHIDAMDRAQILEMGIEMAERQGEQDRVGAELGRLKGAGSKDSQPKKADSGQASEPAPSPELDFDKLLEPFDLELNPEDLPKALKAVADASAKNTEERMASQIDAKLDGFKRDQVVDAVGRQMEERFPQLREAKHKAEVEKVMREIAPAMEYAEGDSLSVQTQKRMERACQLVLGSKATTSKTNPRRRSEKPPRLRRQTKPTKSTRTSNDRDMAFLEKLDDTGNLEAAKRAYRAD